MNVFVYGTLMSPEVVTTLLTRFPRSQAGLDALLMCMLCSANASAVDR